VVITTAAATAAAVGGMHVVSEMHHSAGVSTWDG